MQHQGTAPLPCVIQTHRSVIHISPKYPTYSQINDAWCYFSPCKVSPGKHVHAYTQAPHTRDYFYLYPTELTFLLTCLPAQSPASPAQLLPAQGNQAHHLHAPFAGGVLTPSFLTYKTQMPHHTQLRGDAGLRYTAVTPPKAFLTYGGLNAAPHTAFCCHLHTLPSRPFSSWPILQTGQINWGGGGEKSCFPSTTPFLLSWGKKVFSSCPTASSLTTGKPCMKICPEILSQGQRSHRLPRDGEI